MEEVEEEEDDDENWWLGRGRWEKGVVVNCGFYGSLKYL